MSMTRRLLLGSVAAFVGAAAAPAIPALGAPVSREAAQRPLRLFLAQELQWVIAEYGRALENEDFRPWIVISDEPKPHRMRLARALVLSRELDLTGLHAQILSESFESLWATLTRPSEMIAFPDPWCDWAYMYGRA
jgi:hypothetical protein